MIVKKYFDKFNNFFANFLYIIGNQNKKKTYKNILYKFNHFNF